VLKRFSVLWQQHCVGHPVGDVLHRRQVSWCGNAQACPLVRHDGESQAQ
jgi:hypothetical protein